MFWPVPVRDHWDHRSFRPESAPTPLRAMAGATAHTPVGATFSGHLPMHHPWTFIVCRILSHIFVGHSFLLWKPPGINKPRTITSNQLLFIFWELGIQPWSPIDPNPHLPGETRLSVCLPNLLITPPWQSLTRCYSLWPQRNLGHVWPQAWSQVQLKESRRDL